MFDDLGALSGRLGANYRGSPFLVSNDRGYKDISAELKERFRGRSGDIGVFIGSGGLLSMLPDINLQAALLIDSNRSVLEFTQFLAQLIEQSESAEEAWAKLTDVDSMNLESLKFLARVGGLDLEGIEAEAEVYGGDHWTNPERFGKVKQALVERPVLYIAADIADPEFTASFTDTLNRYGHKISFANLTNVAYYVSDTSFIEQWPLDTDPLIMYSHFPTVVPKELTMFIAHSPQEYRTAVRR